MKTLEGRSVSISRKVRAPIQLAWQALCNALTELEARPGATSLELTVPGPFNTVLSVPVSIKTSQGNTRYEREISIDAVTRKRLFPEFRGVIWLVHTRTDSCDLRLEGAYRVPLASAGAAIDLAILRDAAKTSLERFMDTLAQDVTDRVRLK
jgi:hypothetical protein